MKRKFIARLASVLSCFLMLGILLECCPLSSAASVRNLSGSDIEKIITTWYQEYQKTSGYLYWNRYDNNLNTSEANLKQNVKNGVFSLSGLGFTNEKDTAHGNRFESRKSCMGFTSFMSYCLWGTSSAKVDKNGWKRYTPSQIDWKFQPGDELWANGHAAIVWKVKGNRVYVIEVWGGNKDSKHYAALHFGDFRGNSNYRTVSGLKDASIYAVYRNESGKTKSTVTDLLCNHPSYEYGQCTKCQAAYPGLDKKDYTAAGVYRVKSQTTFMKGKPYSDSTGTKSKTVGAAILCDQEIAVSYAVTNEHGNIWYFGSYNGNTGYLFSDDLTYDHKLPVSIRFSDDITQPLSFSRRSGYSQNLTSGSITATNGTIRSVQAFFYPAGSSVRDSTAWLHRTNVIAVNKAIYNVRSSALNKQLKFGALEAGTYQYGIQAIDSNGDAWYWESNSFTVSPASTPVAQNCALNFSAGTAIDGGVRATVSSSTPGASIQVSPAEYIVQKSAGSVVLDLPSTQTVTASVSASGYQSVSGSQVYYVGSCEIPEIHTNETPDGTVVTLTCSTAEATIYYALDGSNYTVYTTPITLTSTQTVLAYAKKAGCTTSDCSEELISVTVPDAPVLTTGALGTDAAVGTVLAVSWPEISNASAYLVTVTVDGAAATHTVTQPQFSVAADVAGSYQFRVQAKNAVGPGEASAPVTITVHDPLTVRFVNYDGTLLAEQVVPWGSDATAPAVPQRRGYTFAGWDQPFRNIAENLTITALYEIKNYTVKFYDYDGETLIHTQKIRFEDGIDSAAACVYLSKKEGFVFTGWRVVSADAESRMDVNCVDSNMSLTAVRKWENADLPVIISNVSAVRNPDATAYEVSYDITTAPRSELGGDAVGVKIVAVLKSNQVDEAGETIQKTIALAVDSVMLQEDQQKETGKSITVTLGNHGDYTRADVAELYALALDGADRTGGTLSEVVSAVPEITKTWSEWSDSKPDGISEDSLQERTLYRYRDNARQTTSVTTCRETQTALSGWEYADSTSYWGSSFTSDSVLEAGENVELVKTENVVVTPAYKQYRYGRWTNGSNNSYCKSSGKGYYGGTWREEYTAWSNTAYKTCGNDFYCSGGSSHGHTHVAYTDSYGSNWHVYSSSGTYTKSGRWFWQETRTVPAVTKVQYTYRYKYYVNNFYKWVSGNWSEWSTDPVTAIEDSRDVETKTQYRYVTNDTAQLPDTSGTACSIQGSLPGNADLAGKQAAVLVYKTRNTDPTESQLEYVGQITLGENADFALTFKNKEDPTEYTGDYTVALAVQGAGNLLNVAQIRYEANYTVVFTDGSGTTLSTQTVERGGDAVAPEAPEKAGYRFVKWDSQLTDIQENLEIVPIWVPETWSVVFVDHVNQTVQLETGLETGTILSFPQVEAREGYLFNGWHLRRGDDTLPETTDAVSVDGNLIAVADWTRQRCTVTFVDENGETVSTQEVAYGDAAVPPETLTVSADKVFVGWSQEESWWNVTSDMTVSPVVAFQATAAAPTANLPAYTAGISQLLVLQAEDGAVIYYTTDGSDPDLFGTKDGSQIQYTDPIELTEDTTIRAIAVLEGKNDSEIIQIDFEYQENTEEEETGEMIPLQTVSVMAEPSQTVTLQVNLQNNPGLMSAQFVLQADPSVFCVPCDENGAMLFAETLGNTGGSLFVSPYDAELGGWMVFWYTTEACTENGAMLSLTLQTLEDAPAGTYPITLGYIAENTVSCEDAVSELDQGSLLLSMDGGTLLGDVSGDGRVTAVDVIRIAKYIINNYTFTAAQLAAADVTGDGAVTAADVVRLARYLVNLAELG